MIGPRPGRHNRPQRGKPASSRVSPDPSHSPRPSLSINPRRLRQCSLAEAKTNQKAIADELQKMLEGLGEFERTAVVKDAQALLKKQEETMKQSAEAATKPDLMGKSAECYSPSRKPSWATWPPASRIGQGPAKPPRAHGPISASGSMTSDPLAAAAMRDAPATAASRAQGQDG